jgi:hypothetical protein
MFRTSRRVLASILVFISLVAGSRAHAALLEVPESYPGIQLALDASSNGDTVLVAPGHYHERLVIPNRDLTLASHTLLNGDTLFISQTVLDGDSLGSIITAEEGGQHRFVLDGFTLQRGVGYQEHGGAIHMTDSSSVVLRNLYFTRNTSTNGHGSCIYLSGISSRPFRGTQRAELRHIRGWNNTAPDPVLWKVFVKALTTTIVEDVVFHYANSSMLYAGSYLDTCIVKNVHTYSSQCHSTITVGMADASEDSYQLYEDISVLDCQWAGGSLANVSGHAPARVSNVYLEDNEFVGDREGSGVMLSTSFVGSAEFDSLVFARNKGVVQCATGGYFELWRSQPLLEPVHGRIRNLVLIDNVLGDSTYTDWSGNNMPSMIVTRGYSLENAVVRNNTHILTPGQDSPIWGEENANLIRMGVMQMDSFYVRDVLFENNLVIDRDDYASMESQSANEARCLYIGPQVYGDFHVDNVIFDGNLQPNMCPELPYGGLYDDSQDIGAVMMVDGYLAVDNPEKYFSNIVLRNNQDGGFRAADEEDLRMRNITMINMHRQALDLEAERVELDNVLIDGCEPYEAIPFRSEQMPLRLQVTEPSVVSNCTVINSTTPYVVMAGLREPGMSTAPIVRFENCLFANNQYDRFAALIPNYTDTPGWDPYIDGEFNYCLLPEEPVHGNSNLIGLDPLFDEVWGAPYLDPASACIDAGNPDASYNEAEDPENPGWARWPSQGSARADIGVTGGPLAAAIDTNWVSVRDATPSTTRPAGFKIGEPFPNPFNPVTRIPYQLNTPSNVRVRVYSLLGRLLTDQQLGTLPSGQHVYSVDGSRWSTGVYLVEVLAGEERDVKKIMLLK